MAVRLALTGVTAVIAFFFALDRPVVAAPPASTRPSSLEASTSDAARQDAIKLIPMERLAPEDRAKVNSVLSNVSVFRRMPVKVVDCDPDMYLFLVHHPDVVVNIWEVLKLSKLQLRQIEEDQFQITERRARQPIFGLCTRATTPTCSMVKGRMKGRCWPGR